MTTDLKEITWKLCSISLSRLSRFHLRAAFKFGTERKRCKLVWPTPIPEIQLIVRPNETVQNVDRTRGFGSNLRVNIRKAAVAADHSLTGKRFDLLKGNESTTAISSCENFWETSDFEGAKQNHSNNATNDYNKLNEIRPYHRSAKTNKRKKMNEFVSPKIRIRMNCIIIHLRPPKVV